MTVWRSELGDGSKNCHYGIAKSNFSQNGKPNRLTLDVGDAVIILNESGQWYYGYNKNDKSLLGIFPKCYVQVVESRLEKGEYVIKRTEIVEEITTVLREWGNLFKRFYLTNHIQFQPIRNKIYELIRLRSQILSGNLPVDEMREIKLQATSEIDTGNVLLGLDMVVRDDSGNVLASNTISTTALYQHHLNAVNRIKRSSTHNKNRISRTMNRYSHNLMVDVHAFVCKFQGDSDLLLTLYDGDTMKAITENYVVKWGWQGLARNLDEFNNHRVLFTDLSSQDLNRNKVFLICYVVRVGNAMDITKEIETRRSSVSSQVLQANSKKNSQISLNSNSSGGTGVDLQMRRPFGVAAIDLTPVLKKPDDFKNSLDLPFILCEKDNLDSTLRKLVLNKDVSKIDSKLAVTVELLHGDIKSIKDEYHGNVAFARKMGFPEVILPGDVRNDLYLTLANGEFSKGSKTSDKNIEVNMVVCNEQGVIVPGVITLGAGADSVNEYKSVIYYHEDKPKWNETFKIQVPIEEFKQCHLRFTFKHRSSNETKDRSEKPFGLSYVRLMQTNGTTLPQEKHQLAVYKIDYKKFEKDNQLGYLNLPSHVKEVSGKPSANGLTLAAKDSFTIETNLCSTKLTQDVHLLGLLNWASHIDTLNDSLVALMNVNDEEVVKFLQDILDALFNILVQNDDPQKYDDLVFKCLIRLIEIVSDKKYQHFQSVLDFYIKDCFSATLAYGKLITVLQFYIRKAIDDKTLNTKSADGVEETHLSEELYPITKNLQYIMKFIIKSRLLFAKLNDERDQHSFEASIKELLTSFCDLVAGSNLLLRSQGALLKYLHVIATDLMEVYNPILLSRQIADIIREIPSGRLTQSKMLCIKELVDSQLFKLPECREILLPLFCMQLKAKLESKEEGDVMFDIWQQEKNLTKAAKVLGESKSHLHTRETTAKTKVAECVNVMNNILELLHSDDIGNTDNDINEITTYLLRTVIQTAITWDRDNPLVGNLVAIMLGIFQIMRTPHYTYYIDHFGTPVDIKDFLTEILLLFKDLVSKPVFPADWLNMIMYQNQVILGSLRQFADFIMKHFFSPFENQVWSNFFHCSIAFLIQPALQLENFSENKRHTILAQYKDIRKETAELICTMWFNLGEHKTQFVPQLIGPILEMSLIPEEELRKATIPIFFDMMQCEYYKSRFVAESYGDTKRNNTHYKGNFSEFEKELIEKMDLLVEGGRGDDDYRRLFSEIMTKLCAEHNTLRIEGVAFVTMASKLLERLLEYRCIIHDESKENRMACTVSLLQFYSEVNRKEMYIRYVNKLCDLHMEFENYAEAAFTLKRHSNLLMWNNNELSPLLRSNRHPYCQSHRHLKEALYNEIIEYFDKGKMWECAIDMCKELAQQYEREVFDYIKLSVIHRMMAGFFEKILKELRHECEYFRVAFYGLKFPEFLRNKVFVYRGKEYERLSDFCTRILTQHPSAELMQTLTTPGPETTQSDGQFIQINCVEPIIGNDAAELPEKTIAPAIVKYYTWNNVQKFKFSRPLHGNMNSVGSLWLERTIVTTAYPMPGILRWFPVECVDTFKVSPLEHAIETMELTNKAVRDLISAHHNEYNFDVKALGMKINGIVDPAVQGGFGKYEEAFLNNAEEYLAENPNDALLLERLKDLIATQIPLLDYALNVHRAKVPSDLLPFHDRLEKCFAAMQADVEAKYGKKISDLKYERDPYVTIRRAGGPMSLGITGSMDPGNRHSETSMGSSDSGLSKSTQQGSRPSTSTIKSTFSGFNFNTSNLTRTSFTSSTKDTKDVKMKAKEKTKRRSSRKDRESLSLPTANSQWYTSTGLSTIVSTSPSDRFDGAVANILTPATPPVVELTEELTPKRPLRSEAVAATKERRTSRPASLAPSVSSVKSLPYPFGDNQSLSGGEDSNRNSIVTIGSTTSDEELLPPPLPAKLRDSTDYSQLSSGTDENGFLRSPMRNSHYFNSNNKRTVSSVSNNNYEYCETKSLPVSPCLDDKRRPPTPPPKPARNSSKCSQVSG